VARRASGRCGFLEDFLHLSNMDGKVHGIHSEFEHLSDFVSNFARASFKSSDSRREWRR
jgi:hypothetical protein